jgi:erythromycin esterase-like protein
MLTRIIVSVVMVFAARVAVCAESELQPLTPYSLPAAAEQPIKELADRSDVLILGESHGTKEVPEIVAALLPTLSKMDYQVLALEVPSDQQAAITDWATGKTQTLPSFYAKPGTDGRGNQQMLSLIGMALSPPYR